MTPQLVIFDCDGVLVDSEPAANEILTRMLIGLGLQTDLAGVCRDFVGLSMTRCLEIVEGRLGRKVPPAFEVELQQRTFEAFREKLDPVPGVAEALDRLDLPFCVASSGEHEKMQLTLGLTGLLSRFENRMFSATEVENGKPHPDLFLHAARELGVAPEGCVVVEDSLPGVQAARAAGMVVYAYSPGAGGAALESAGAILFGEMSVLNDLIHRAPSIPGVATEERE
jgi:HAD superfamily hydrolase (TIGR01509 family)